MGWNPPGTHVQSLAGAERRVVLNPGVPAYRSILADQVAALSSIGVDGIHIARFFGRTLNFNPKTETTPDRASWEGGLKTLAAMREAARKHNPAFLVLADDSFDSLGACVDACGAALSEHSPLEIAYPQWQKMIRLTDPAKADLVDGTDLTNSTVVLAPKSGFAAFDDAAWKSLIERLLHDVQK